MRHLDLFATLDLMVGRVYLAGNLCETYSIAAKILFIRSSPNSPHSTTFEEPLFSNTIDLTFFFIL